jgi:4-amino-4-deoxy-L-arabinose transferase-like glycosyltransferase
MQYLNQKVLVKIGLPALLIAVAGTFYAIIISQLGSFDFIKQSLYNTYDSLEYKAYADWISGKPVPFIPYRTFFYPLLIFISQNLFGFYGIWIFQFIFWVSACLLTHQTIIRLTGNRYLALLSFVIAASNVSMIVYTAHALTEITTFCCLSLFLYFLTYINRMNTKPRILLILIFLLSVLAVIKPLFQPVWYAAVIVIILFCRKRWIKKPLIWLLLVLFASPVIIQKSINLNQASSFSTTTIADNTLRLYLYKKVMFYHDAGKNDAFKTQFNDLTEDQQDSLNRQASSVEMKEVYRFLLYHPVETTRVYWENIRENLGSGNPYINRKKNYSFAKWTENVNSNFIYYIHLIMTLVWIYFVINSYGRPGRNRTFIFTGGILAFFILYSSGISFWAGNRLIIPAVALWSVLYPLMIYNMLPRQVNSKIENFD